MEAYKNSYIRSLNSRLVLEHVIQLGPISRAELARQTGLTKATVSAITAELISAGLAADLLGDVLLFRHLLTPDASGLIAALAELIASMQAAVAPLLPEQTHGLCGIALGIHGVVCGSRISFSPHYRMEQLPIAAELEQRFRVPVIIDNEANLAVTGEAAFLPPADRSIAALSIHSGVGAGLLLNGRLYTGYLGGAGEFGHTILVPGGRPCACGRLGCLVQYVSDRKKRLRIQWILISTIFPSASTTSYRHTIRSLYLFRTVFFQTSRSC